MMLKNKEKILRKMIFLFDYLMKKYLYVLKLFNLNIKKLKLLGMI